MVDLQVKKECDVFDPNPGFEGFKPIYPVKPGEPANDVSYSVRALTPEGAALLKEWCSEEDPPYTDHAGTTCILCLLSAQLNDLIKVVTKANLTIGHAEGVEDLRRLVLSRANEKKCHG